MNHKLILLAYDFVLEQLENFIFSPAFLKKNISC